MLRNIATASLGWISFLYGNLKSMLDKTFNYLISIKKKLSITDKKVLLDQANVLKVLFKNSVRDRNFLVVFKNI